MTAPEAPVRTIPVQVETPFGRLSWTTEIRGRPLLGDFSVRISGLRFSLPVSPPAAEPQPERKDERCQQT